jgi:hypothetical protein
VVSAAPSAEPYSERLGPPWWLSALIVAGAAGVAAEIHLGYPGVRAWLPYALLVPAAVLLVFWLRRLRVRVTGGADRQLWVDDAHIPVVHLGTGEALGGYAKADALGPHLDPLAFLITRPWIRQFVRVTVTDPADPTPYWLVPTRHPDRLLAALGLSPVDLPASADHAGPPR